MPGSSLADWVLSQQKADAEAAEAVSQPTQKRSDVDDLESALASLEKESGVTIPRQRESGVGLSRTPLADGMRKPQVANTEPEPVVSTPVVADDAVPKVDMADFASPEVGKELWKRAQQVLAEEEAKEEEVKKEAKKAERRARAAAKKQQSASAVEEPRKPATPLAQEAPPPQPKAEVQQRAMWPRREPRPERVDEPPPHPPGYDSHGLWDDAKPSSVDAAALPLLPPGESNPPAERASVDPPRRPSVFMLSDMDDGQQATGDRTPTAEARGPEYDDHGLWPTEKPKRPRRYGLESEEGKRERFETLEDAEQVKVGLPRRPKYKLESEEKRDERLLGLDAKLEPVEAPRGPSLPLETDQQAQERHGRIEAESSLPDLEKGQKAGGDEASRVEKLNAAYREQNPKKKRAENFDSGKGRRDRSESGWVDNRRRAPSSYDKASDGVHRMLQAGVAMFGDHTTPGSNAAGDEGDWSQERRTGGDGSPQDVYRKRAGGNRARVSETVDAPRKARGSVFGESEHQFSTGEFGSGMGGAGKSGHGEMLAVLKEILTVNKDAVRELKEISKRLGQNPGGQKQKASSGQGLRFPPIAEQNRPSRRSAD